MKEQDLNHCARAFEKETVDGAELLELPREDFMPMLPATGAIDSGHHAYL